jgi:hypothetical protein
VDQNVRRVSVARLLAAARRNENVSLGLVGSNREWLGAQSDPLSTDASLEVEGVILTGVTSEVP